MLEEEYAEYRCCACKKEIKSVVVQCKQCVKLFYHPSCASKHKIIDRNNELVKCEGPYVKFTITEDKTEMNKTMASGTKTRKDSTSSTGSTPGISNKSGIDVKVDRMINMIKEMKDIMVCKDSIKELIKDIVNEELEDIKREIRELKGNLTDFMKKPTDILQKSYAETIKENKENVIIVRPINQQESETTKKQVKERVDITNLAVGITKFRKGDNGSVILGCESKSEIDKLKASVKDKLGEDFRIIEPKKIKPKIKIVNVGMDELNMSDENLIDTIKKQNICNDKNVGFYMKITKKQTKSNKSNNNDNSINPNKENINQGLLILELDESTHENILKKGKINIGWNKCRVFQYFNVKRCFKCWGFHHIAKNCSRQVTCYKCAENHLTKECTTTIKKCINCMHKIRKYNVQISDDHEALSMDCPTFKRILEEEKKRNGWETGK